MAVKQPVEAVETELRKLNQHELEKLQQLKDKIQDLLYPDVSFQRAERHREALTSAVDTRLLKPA